MNYQTEQEQFWAGEFGDEYSSRNRSEALVAANTALFARIFSRTTAVHSLIEFGANIGLNLVAIQRLIPTIELSAVEINPIAQQTLQQMGHVQLYPMSILDYQPDRTRDFVLSKGVLIHINPKVLTAVYHKLYQASHRYICLIEYYNPTPVEIPYRGHTNKLFKRDFAGDLLDLFPNLQLVDYGFAYHRDPNFKQDDITWFLLEKP